MGQRDVTVRTVTRRLHVLLAVVYVVAAALVVGCLWYAVRSPSPSLWRLILVAAAMAVGEAPLVQLRFGHQLEFFALGEAAVVVGLVLLPVVWLVSVGSAAVLFMYVVSRRPFLKAAYNASVAAVGLAGAGSVVHLAVGRIAFPHVSLTAIAVVMGGGLFYGLWSMVAVAAVSASSGVPLRVKLGQGRRLRAAFLVANTILGLGVLALAHWSPLTLFVLPPVLFALVLAHRSSLRSMEQRDAWRHLNAAAKELVHLDELTIVGQAQERARQLFRPDDVELLLQPSASDAPALPGAPARGGKRRVEHVTAPLRSASGAVGVLRLRFAESVEWSDHEDQVLSAFAHTVSSALVNARLYAEARQQAQEKAHEAAHDALTGLGNRRLLLDQAAEALRVAEAARGCVGLLLIDLDRFKEVNDTLGHNAGDRLLCGVAERLRRSVRSADLVARLGGDEFAVLVGGIGGPPAAESVASELAEVIARPVTFDGMTLAVEASVGVACFPEDGRTVEELLQRADVAMYQAKASNERYVRYRADRDDSTLDRLALVAELRSALSGGELLLHYQPQLDLRTGRITRVEALVRWEHPRRGLLGPERFVPVVEQTGLVRDFTGSVLDEALGRARARRPRASVSASR